MLGNLPLAELFDPVSGELVDCSDLDNLADAFERMKEELKKNKSISEALHEGFKRAWLSIRDSNISSIITAIVLFWLGTSAVKGFALTLGIGVLISMFTAITVSRTFLFAIAPTTDTRIKRFLFSNGLARRSMTEGIQK